MVFYRIYKMVKGHNVLGVMVGMYVRLPSIWDIGVAGSLRKALITIT